MIANEVCHSFPQKTAAACFPRSCFVFPFLKPEEQESNNEATVSGRRRMVIDDGNRIHGRSFCLRSLMVPCKHVDDTTLCHSAETTVCSAPRSSGAPCHQVVDNKSKRGVQASHSNNMSVADRSSMSWSCFIDDGPMHYATCVQEPW